MFEQRLTDAWLHAALDLAIRVVAPFDFKTPSADLVRVEAFLPDFGGPRGAVVVPLSDRERGEVARAGRYFVSLLGSSYLRFDKELFRETLDDWGWFGEDADRPDWYTGKPWS